MDAQSLQNVTAESERKKRHREPEEALGEAMKKHTLPDGDHFGSSCSAPREPDYEAPSKVAPSIADSEKALPDPDMNCCNSPSSQPLSSNCGAGPSIGPPIWQVGADCGG